jgi:pimeloyl-ACP methyl ester carboxylesterase
MMPTWRAEDGTKIYYEMSGDTKAQACVVLLPGILGTIASQWGRFARAIAGGNRIILVDLRGHGRSDNIEPRLDPHQMLDDLVGLLTALEITDAHLVGYDFGGYLALMYCLSQPQRALSLTMHATKFYWVTESARRMREQMNPDVMADTAPSYADLLAREHGSRWRSLARQAGDLIARLGEDGLTEGMARRLRTPVLVSVGDRDELVPLPEAQRLSRLFPAGSLLVVPGVSHPFAALREVPFVPTVKSFHKHLGW